jgi:hypothetical protein
MFLSFFAEAPCKPKTYSSEPPVVKTQLPAFRYEPSDAAQRAHEARLRERMANQDAWRGAADEKGFRYPAKPQPVTPRNEFEQRQVDYSESVRNQRK